MAPLVDRHARRRSRAERLDRRPPDVGDGCQAMKEDDRAAAAGPFENAEPACRQLDEALYGRRHAISTCRAPGLGAGSVTRGIARFDPGKSAAFDVVELAIIKARGDGELGSQRTALP